MLVLAPPRRAAAGRGRRRASGFALTPIVWQHLAPPPTPTRCTSLLVVAPDPRPRCAGRRSSPAPDAHPGDAAYRRRADRAIVLAAAHLTASPLANHGLALILAPVDRAVRPRRGAAASCTGRGSSSPRWARRLGVAALLYLELPLRAGPFRAPLVYGAPRHLAAGSGTIVLARQFQGDVNGLVRRPRPARRMRSSPWRSAQLGPLMVLVPVGLLVAAVQQPKYALFSGTAVLVTVTSSRAPTPTPTSPATTSGRSFFAWTWIAILAGALCGASSCRPRRRRWRRRCAPVEAVDRGPRPPASSGSRSRSSRSSSGSRCWCPRGHRRQRPVEGRRPVGRHLGARVARRGVQRHEPRRRGDLVVDATRRPMWYGELVEGRRRDILIVDDSNAVWTTIWASSPDVIDRVPRLAARLRHPSVSFGHPGSRPAATRSSPSVAR